MGRCGITATSVVGGWLCLYILRGCSNEAYPKWPHLLSDVGPLQGQEDPGQKAPGKGQNFPEEWPGPFWLFRWDEQTRSTLCRSSHLPSGQLLPGSGCSVGGYLGAPLTPFWLTPVHFGAGPCRSGSSDCSHRDTSSTPVFQTGNTTKRRSPKPRCYFHCRKDFSLDSFLAKSLRIIRVIRRTHRS